MGMDTTIDIDGCSWNEIKERLILKKKARAEISLQGLLTSLL